MRAVVTIFATFMGTTSAHATTCSEAVARCKVAGASKPNIGKSCEMAGASCIKTGRFRGPVTNTIWPDHLTFMFSGRSPIAKKHRKLARASGPTGSNKQTDEPWNGVPEKEQRNGDAKPDLEQWQETSTH